MEPSQLSDDARPVKRRRVALACDACRTRKSRCDGGRPSCSICVTLGFECIYTPPPSATNLLVRKDYLQAIESRMSILEATLGSVRSELSDLSACVHQKGNPEHIGDEELGPATSSSLPDLADIEDPIDAMGAVTFADEEDCGFFGPSSNIAFLRHLSRAATGDIRRQKRAHSPVNPSAFDGGVVNISRPPSPVPKSVRQEPLDLFALPPRHETLELIQKYFSDTGLLFPYIYPPTFFETFQYVMDHNLKKIRRTWLGLLNIMLAMVKITAAPGTTSAQVRLSEANVFYQRALGLCGNEMLRGTTLEVVQFLLLMGQYLQGTQKSVQAWTMHGLATKAALQLGLHSKDASGTFSPLEQEVRKRTWYGCVLLDRTLSMNLGRPASIPDSYVRLELPKHDENLVVPMVDPRDVHLSTLFFNSTISLYKQLFNIIDLLYGQNLSCDPPLSVSELIGHILTIEHNLILWEKSLPEDLRLITMKDVPDAQPAGSDASRHFLKLRVILTLRYLHLKILLHRPILVKFIDAYSSVRNTNSHEERLLQQMGSNSLRSCSEAAMEIIDIVHDLLDSTEWHKSLLGAWWFTLYYTFHSALILLGTIWIHKKGGDTIKSLVYDIDRINMYPYKAVQTLQKLDVKNRIVDRCRYYIERSSNLSNILDNASRVDRGQPEVDNHIGAVTDSTVKCSPCGLEFGEFMLDDDFWAAMNQQGFLSDEFAPSHDVE